MICYMSDNYFPLNLIKNDLKIHEYFTLKSPKLDPHWKLEYDTNNIFSAFGHDRPTYVRKTDSGMGRREDDREQQHTVPVEKKNTTSNYTEDEKSIWKKFITGLTWNDFISMPHIKLLIYLINTEAMYDRNIYDRGTYQKANVGNICISRLRMYIKYPQSK